MAESITMEMLRQVREAMEDEGFTPTTDNGWIGTVQDVARLAREHSRRRDAHTRRHDVTCPYVYLPCSCSAEAGDTDG